MGTCISKCMPNPPATARQLCTVPHDKLVVSQTPCAASSARAISHGHHQYNSSSVSSSSSSSSATTSISSSICASSCSSSSSKDGHPRSEPPWASARPPPHIVVLDPGSCKQISPLRANPVDNFLGLQAPGAFPRKTADAPRKLSHPPKRARSTSPALVRQKSFRSSPEQSSAVPTRSQRQSSPCRPVVQARQATEARQWTPSPSLVSRLGSSKVSLGSRSLASPSPGRRFDVGGAAGRVRTKSMSEELPSHELKTRAGPPGTRKERLRNTSSPSVSGLLHAPRWRRRSETSVHPIVAPVLEREVAEIISDRDCGLAQMEDMNNPLIALDCFIFL